MHTSFLLVFRSCLYNVTKRPLLFRFFKTKPNMAMPCRRLYFLLLALIVSFVANEAQAAKIVKELPGFEGELPFNLNTGYITVDDSELFYYFIESERNPEEDPILLWYSGGPGCSAFNGLIFENGPLRFNITEYLGGVPSTEYYPYGWTKQSSILFVDAPVGSGFSYSTTQEGWYSSDTKSAWQTFQFLRKWLIAHPQYLGNQLFVGADSYSGVSGSIVVKHMIDANDAGVVPRLNLKGYILGCPRIDKPINENSKLVFAHRLALVSDDLYEAAVDSCNGTYYEASTSNTKCYETLEEVAKLLKDINKHNIVEPKCTWASPEQDSEMNRRALEESPPSFILSPPKIPDFWCHNFNYALSYIWANDERVQDALGVRQGKVLEWSRCNKSLAYTYDVESALYYQRYLSTKGLQVLIYNGDHDLVIPVTGTQEWIRELNLTVVNDWRSWLVDGQIAGYTKKYSEHGYRLTFTTIKGAGHTPQEYKRRESYEMFRRFIHFYPI